MTEGQKVAAVLRQAVAKMNNGGKHWTKGALRRRRGNTVSYCSIGGIHAATRSPTLRVLAREQLTNVVGDIMVWNDSPERRWPEVKAAFTKAAKLAEKEPA